MGNAPQEDKELYSAADTGSISQNVYLYAGQPQEAAPLLAADVRPPPAKRAVCAALGAQSVSTRSCLYH